MNFGYTTSSGYTFPIQMPNTQNPTSGIPLTTQAEMSSSSGSSSLLSYIFQQNSNEKDALSMLWDLAQVDPSYMELYLQLKAERENYKQQWEDYLKYQEIAPGLTYQAYKDAGMNPWLALQSFGANIGSGSSASMGTFGSSGSSYYAKSKLQSEKVDETHLDKVVGVVGSVVGLLIAALIGAML